MDWFVAAIVSAIALSGQALFFQRLQRVHPVRAYVTYVWLGAALLLALVFLRPTDLPSIRDNIAPLLLAGLSSWGGIYAYNRAIKLQTNIGYIEAVVALRIAITYIFSIWAFSASLDLQRLLGIVCIMMGVFAVTGMQRLNLDEFRIGWLRWALAVSITAAIYTGILVDILFVGHFEILLSGLALLAGACLTGSEVVQLDGPKAFRIASGRRILRCSRSWLSATAATQDRR